MAEPTHLKIRFRGSFIGGKWVYSKPRTVETPIPYISRSEKTGEVVCGPIGTFDYADGQKLLELSGPDGPFVLEETIYPEESEEEPAPTEEVRIIVEQPQFQRVGDPNAMVQVHTRTEHEQLLIRKRINRAQLQRGKRKRAVRSDKGVPRPKQISADTVVQQQADSEPTPQIAAG